MSGWVRYYEDIDHAFLESWEYFEEQKERIREASYGIYLMARYGKPSAGGISVLVTSSTDGAVETATLADTLSVLVDEVAVLRSEVDRIKEHVGIP